MMRARWFFLVALLAAVLAAPLSMAAQTAASAKAFLQSVYANYEKGGKGIKDTKPYFHSSLQRLLETDLREAHRHPHEVPGALDADYFLDAQEYDGVWDLKVEVMMTDPGKAVARVSMKIYSPKNRSGDASQDGRTFRILLVAEQGEWRIWDLVLIVRGEPDNSWRASLKQDIDGFRHPEK